MAKYQVVFTKLEATVQKLCYMRRTRELLCMKAFFRKFRENCKTMSKKMQAVTALKKVKKAIRNMLRTHKKTRASLLRKYLLKFKVMAEARKYAEEMGKASTKKGISEKDKEIASLRQWVNQKAKEVENLRKVQDSLKERLRQDRGTSSDSKRLKVTSPRSCKHSKDHAKALKSRVRELERENKVLREEWEETEGSVENFIQEVTEMIESQEFARNFLCPGVELKLETEEDKETDADVGGSSAKAELAKKSPHVMTARAKPAAKFNKKYKLL